jgi:hypothetical protein
MSIIRCPVCRGCQCDYCIGRAKVGQRCVDCLTLAVIANMAESEPNGNAMPLPASTVEPMEDLNYLVLMGMEGCRTDIG